MLFQGLFSKTSPEEKTRRRYAAVVARINEREAEMNALSDDALRAKTDEFRARLSLPAQAGDGASLDELLPEAFAAVREAACRVLGQRHYDVQLIGGAILHEGKIAEMRTGEGKTLAATLPVYLNALSGEGVHVVTVNDYLARRDTVWMGQIYHFLGLTVGCVTSSGSYLYDPLFTKDNESQENEISKSKFLISKKIPNSKFPVRDATHSVADGQIQNSDTLDTIRDTLGSFKVVHEYLKPCSKKEAYAADITYGTNNEFGFDYLRDNIAYDLSQLAQVRRLTQNERGQTQNTSATVGVQSASFRDGESHNFAIVDEIDSILIDEARTPLIISAPSEDPEELYYTFARIAAAMQGDTDYTVDEKLRAISLTDAGITKAESALGIGNIYTEKGVKYVHHLENAVRAKALFHRDKAYVVKDGSVIIVDEFTGRLQPGRRWSEGLHQAIEAKEGLKVEKESRTVASITFQNYFRLYEKIAGMTGTAKTSEEEFLQNYRLSVTEVPTHKPTIRKNANDLIFQTERGKLAAVVQKIKELHENGQPILVGTVSIEKNEELSALLEKERIPHEVLNAKNHEREGEIIAQAGRLGAVTIATNMAGRGVDIILSGNPPDAETQKKIRELGGLFVLGTERHEARRIDNQLRGRAGRQGDPGASQFFVSLEDSLMRVFASDTIKNLMGRFGIPEDQPIENSLVSRALESAQTKIEGFHFDARKHVLEYDNVLNRQRHSIYELRRKLLLGEQEAIIGFLSEIREKDEKAGELLHAAEKKMGEHFIAVAGRVILQTIDEHWMEHLDTMDHLRQSVNLRAYGQHDPLVEYKKEGLRLFKEMQESIDQQVVNMLTTLADKEGEAASITSEEKMRTMTNRPEEQSSFSQNATAGKVGRNDPCPCGSGKKYKKCHGK